MNLVVRGQESQQVICANPVTPVRGVRQPMRKEEEPQQQSRSGG